ncbi:ankyrin-2-like [Strongylocentrotus purpuratus]|uniref:Death domain-containing protein n=1 Tax=Strongylocentrotus purpuratus TaxID=7668 RepID=A0A7M7P012_STRPU|nr:ankyrin-2-like [Strongylocentrotus purpuratus]
MDNLTSSKKLICRGTKMNKVDNDGRTALQLASDGRHDVTKYLSSQGAEVNNGGNLSLTPLRVSRKGNAKCLIHKDSKEENEQDGRVDNLQSALSSAAQNGQLDLIQELIGRGVEVNNGGEKGLIPLHIAAKNGNLDVTKFLISQGAEMNKVDNDGWTALHLASDGHLDVTKYLISQGVEVNNGGNNNVTPLHIAAGTGHLDVTKFRISQGAEVNHGGMEAACHGHLDVTKELISQCADFNKTDYNGWTALHLAAHEGHLDVVTELISQGADVDRASVKGWSALYLAAAAGHVRVSSALLTQQAELAKANIIHWMELHSAAERDDLDAMKDQVSQGAELDKAGSFGWTALQLAASNGHLDMIKYLLSQGADVNSSNDFGRCALHSASKKGNLDVVEYLISEGADMNNRQDLGLTSLHFASLFGHLDIVKSLITHGVEEDIGNAIGTTALHYALCNRRIDITKYLLSHGSELNKRSVWPSVILQFDGQYGHYDVRGVHSRVVQAVSTLIDSLTVFRGAPESDLGRSKYQDGDEDKTVQGGMVIVHRPFTVSDLDNQDLLASQGDRTIGRTSLQYAVEGGCHAVVRYVVSKGAEVNESNNVGWTALHVAAQMGHLGTVDYLLGQGAEVAKGDVDDISPLHVAAFVSHCDVIEHLLRRGAEVNGATKEKGSTALHVGVQNGHLDITKGLLNHGAEIDATDNDGWTPLHIAAQNGHIDVMKCLLQQLADVRQVTKKGSSALHLSAANGHTEVTRYLLEHGAEVNLIKPDQTALSLAAEQDQVHRTSPDTWCAEGQKHPSSPNGRADTEGLTEDEKKVVWQHPERGCTAVHLATQNGYTSIIETLVSHGADLNSQSIDGQTCLHEAISLSGREESKVEATPALQKISEVFYQKELSPGKALVFYLLDHGAKPDIKDNHGNLPVHYAKDEVVRQMIFSRVTTEAEKNNYANLPESAQSDRTDSVEPINQPLDSRYATGTFGALGGTLSTKSHGFTLHIPPGALEEDEKISLRVLTEIPNGLTLKEDELINDVHNINDFRFQPVKGDDDDIEFLQGTLKVACQVGEKSPKSEEQAIQFSDKRSQTKETKYFELDLTKESEGTLVTLEVVQTSTQMIKFTTRFEGIEESLTKQDTPSPSTVGIPSEESSEQDFDDLLKTIANRIHKVGDIDNLGRELGFQPPEIQRYLRINEKDHDVTCRGTLSMLRDWRDRTTSSEEREQLKKALIAIRHQRLVDDLLKDDMAS